MQFLRTLQGNQLIEPLGGVTGHPLTWYYYYPFGIPIDYYNLAGARLLGGERRVAPWP